MLAETKKRGKRGERKKPAPEAQERRRGPEGVKKEVGDLATSLEPRESGTEVRRISDTAT